VHKLPFAGAGYGDGLRSGLSRYFSGCSCSTQHMLCIHPGSMWSRSDFGNSTPTWLDDSSDRRRSDRQTTIPVCSLLRQQSIWCYPRLAGLSLPVSAGGVVGVWHKRRKLGRRRSLAPRRYVFVRTFFALKPVLFCEAVYQFEVVALLRNARRGYLADTRPAVSV